ncbi:MAG: Fur family ferric uptake transcriptional regulator [bacterium]|jgi:Fur family ferric uptake transcriptional regulator
MCKRCDFTQVFQHAGIRKTKKRSLILDILANRDEPLTHLEIQQVVELKYQDAQINRVTIYRILELFVSNGILNRIPSPDHVDRYCLAENPKHPKHAHFYCLECKQMKCVESKELQWKLEIPKNFFGRVEMVQVLIDGVCQTCLPIAG